MGQEMKSALFVDLDNVFSGLRRLEPAAAERFAFQPMQWVRWLEESLALADHATGGSRRRLLVRRCYLNPQVYQRFRPAFNRAGFEIIDCPAMTSEGKTSTDIHMVLGIVELLQHEIRTTSSSSFPLMRTSLRSCASCAAGTGARRCWRSAFLRQPTRRQPTC